jgi:hypothetical protein
LPDEDVQKFFAPVERRSSTEVYGLPQLTLTLDFPAGGTDITPLCGITMTATTTDVAAGRIAAAYTGTTTCEGPITDGTLVVMR